MTRPVKKVLIAHQSTIPHYRIAFYEAVERLRPNWWKFFVVYDASQARKKTFLSFDLASVSFGTRESRTYTVRLAGKDVSFQTFPFDAAKYDLLILGSELNNLSYPISYLWKLSGKLIAFWGHGRDSSVVDPRGFKALGERTKVWLTRRADAFFAYTDGVRDYMAQRGVDPRKIFVLRNTIDIAKHRASFESLISQREALRSNLGLSGKKVLLFVGRLNRRKHLDMLFRTLRTLRSMDPAYHLIIIGAGDASMLYDLETTCGRDSFDYPGIVPDADIGHYYVASDLYAFPGAVGLGPLQALCFDLNSAVIDSPAHNPEYEYLSHQNALILPNGSSPCHYAFAIDSLLKDHSRWAALRASAWPTIKHLTIEKMAANFIAGINSILENGRAE